jgi:Arc/MetJ-type ribon-helix-helix transcriptional regulator
MKRRLDLKLVAELLAERGCATAGEISDVLNVHRDTAKHALRALVWRGLAREFALEVRGRFSIFCRRDVDASAALRLFAARVAGVGEEELRERIRDFVKGALSITTCITPRRLGVRCRSYVCRHAVLAYAISLIGGYLVEDRVCVFVRDALERLARGEFTPQFIREVEHEVREADPGEREGPMPIVAVHLPPRMLNLLEDLVRRGRYRSVSDAVRSAVAEMLEQYKPLAERFKHGTAGMRAIKLHLDPETERRLEALLGTGLYASIPEAVREAVRKLLLKYAVEKPGA